MHVVTEEEAQSKAYSIEDVVMPLPGAQVQYPVYQTSEKSTTCCTEEDSQREASKGLPQVSTNCCFVCVKSCQVGIYHLILQDWCYKA